MSTPQSIDVIQSRIADATFVTNAQQAGVAAAIGVLQSSSATPAEAQFASAVIASPAGYTQQFAYVAAEFAASDSPADISAALVANFATVAGVAQVNAAPQQVTRAQLAVDPNFQARCLQAVTDAATAYLNTEPPTVAGGATQTQVDEDAIEREFAARIQAGDDVTPALRLQFAMNILSDPSIIAISDPSAVTDAQIAQAVQNGATRYVTVQEFLKANSLPAT